MQLHVSIVHYVLADLVALLVDLAILVYSTRIPATWLGHVPPQPAVHTNDIAKQGHE